MSIFDKNDNYKRGCCPEVDDLLDCCDFMEQSIGLLSPDPDDVQEYQDGDMDGRTLVSRSVNSITRHEA